MAKKLTKTQKEDIKQVMEDGGGSATFSEWLSQHQHSDTPLECAQRMLEYSPEVPQDQMEAYEWCRFLNDRLGLSENTWYSRGLARRFTLDDPRELQLFISMHARVNRCLKGAPKSKKYAGDEYVNIWDVLKALAVRDIDTARCWAAAGTYPLDASHYFASLYNGVFAVLRDEMDELKRLEKHLSPKSASKWVRAMLQCLLAIPRRDKSMVAESIETMLAGYSRTDLVMDLHKTICFEAHGFYALCHLVDPALVEAVKIDRDLPWDKGLWSITYQDSDPYVMDTDLTWISQEFHDAIVRLQEPIWWASKHEGFECA